MVGRYKKDHHEIKREISIELPSGAKFLLATMVITCPVCQSTDVSTNGTRKRKVGRAEAFQCKNPNCQFLQHHKCGKQFLLSTSHLIKEQIWTLLTQLYKDIIQEGAKSKTIARKYHISDALVTHLRRDLEDTIDSHRGLDHLVEIPQEDRAIAIDETFLKIQGKSIYIIIATGYTSKKILGMKVSESRNEEDMREVFDEAERNTKEPLNAATSDAWTATQKMAKHLNREFTLIIHKHKSPYDTAVIRHFRYSSTERLITDIGVHVDIFKYRRTRKYYYLETSELLQAPAANPRGRPKGQKKRQKKAKPKIKKQRGRKGLDAVFSKGKQSIVKVDPYRKTLRFGKKMSGSVVVGLNQAFSLFAGKTIQNNLSETINSVFKSHICLSGPKTVESAGRVLRTMAIVRNNSALLENIKVEHSLRVNFLFNNVNVDCLSRMIEKGWELYSVKKMD